MRTLRTRIRSAASVAALAAGFALAAGGAAAQPSPAETPLGVPAHGALEDPFNRALLLDQFEAIGGDGSDLRWDAEVWLGNSRDKLRIRSEGERAGRDTERAELELLWSHAFARWWDVVAGARTDFAPGSGKTWAAFGVQGMAPYRFEIGAQFFVASTGDTAARIEAEYELLVTNRLILQPQLELDWYGQSDARRGYGAGLSSGELALRLRYEVRREVAPYVGLVRERLWGDAADAARAAGHDADDTSLVAGIRLRF